MEKGPILITVGEGQGFAPITYRENEIHCFSYRLQDRPGRIVARLLRCLPFPFPVPLGATRETETGNTSAGSDSITFCEHHAIKNRDHAHLLDDVLPLRRP